ncbi:AMP-binding protein [uncultured Algimonas sp.]|uniref:class I adenylate-forming enzyme family protein n=1 Tax=uncultured Algimonas sp. TaxID=1547920 RepID=UPI00261A7B9C|nr:AMP-binding protein [uncultured Algimonas sp.]
MAERAWLKVHEALGAVPPDFQDLPFGGYVERHARNNPDAVALRFMQSATTYGKLDRLANRFANVLAGLGVGRGDVVGLHMPNIPQYAVAVAALSKLGAIGSGVSPLLAPPELAHQIDDAGISLLVTLSDFAPALAAMPHVPDGLEHLISVGAGDTLGAPDIAPMDLAGVDGHTWQNLTAEAPDTFAQVDVDPHDTFMIQYTGGTTGRPKGAELSHRNVMHNPRMVAALDPDLEAYAERYASAFPFFHIAGLSMICSAVIHGAELFLLPDPRDVDHFVDMMRAHPPTILAGVPALYDMLLAHPGFAQVDWSRLKVAKSGAAPLTRTTYDKLSAVIGANKIADVFGMTETGPCHIAHPVSRYKLGSIGVPMPGTDLKIMDVETGTTEMPAGEPGEIVTAGPQVMRGYLGLPGESARALREIEGRRYMFTGDVGYLDADGYVFLCDRAKDMLVVGGFKVFSVEVEDKLKAHPDVAESAVVGAPDEARPGNDIVHLFVQRAPDSAGSDRDAKDRIRDWIRANMAPYKVPKHIHVVDAIPLTPVGKIDKKAMRAQVRDR